MAPPAKKRCRHERKKTKTVVEEDLRIIISPTKNEVVRDRTGRKFNFTTPRTVFESLIAPTTVEDFFSNYWEKKPLVVRRRRRSTGTDDNCGTDDKKDNNDDNNHDAPIFSKEILESMLQNHKLTFVRDVNVVSYVDRKRQDLNGNGRFTVRKFRRSFYRDRGTVQIHQPQRFQGSLWQIMENLESFFGCLVGANVYMTPSKAQGLPPHHDDVEVFVVQIEGKKHWRLYKPMVALPREYSGDLDESDLGQPVVDVVLRAGDVMYFPRGTIHQACAEGRGGKRGHSTHVTISTYQRQTWGDYLLSVFPSLLEEAMSSDVSFRKGLPINFVRSAKIPKVENSGKLHSVVDLLLSKLKYKRFLPPEAMIEDFMQNRLPPFSVDTQSLKDEPPAGFPPNLSSRVRLKFPDHVCCLIKKDPPVENESSESDDSDEDDDDNDDSDNSDGAEESSDGDVGREMLYVYTSLFNDRRTHMMFGKTTFADNTEKQHRFNDVGLALKFPPHLLDTMESLRASTVECTASDFVRPVAIRPSDIEHLLCSLWSSHLLDVCSTSITNVNN